MQFKRRSTFRDKIIGILATFLSVLLFLNVFEIWKVYGQVKVLDIIVGILGFVIATIFTNIFRFTYLEFKENKVIWSRAIFFKKEISGDNIKEIKCKMNHVILIDQKGKETWIPMTFLKQEDTSQVTDLFKKL